MNYTNGDTGTHCELKQKETEVVVRIKKESLRDTFTSCLLSHLCTSGQWLCQVDTLISLLVLENYNKLSLSAPSMLTLERCGGG